MLHGEDKQGVKSPVFGIQGKLGQILSLTLVSYATVGMLTFLRQKE